MKIFKIIFITLAILLSCSCAKTGEFEPMPELSAKEFSEAISGDWNLCCIGRHTESIGKGAEKVIAVDTLTSAIEQISYRVNGNDYEITLTFSGSTRIENILIADGKSTCTVVSVDRYIMHSSSPDTFPLEFERDDYGKEVFRTLSVQESTGLHEHSYNYQIRYFGNDRIADFEIKWFILQSDHLYYQFVRKTD